MENIAYALTKKQALTPLERPVPKAGPGEVAIRVCYVGVCGSDAHFFESGFRGETPIPMPFVLGHECSGVIVGVGDGVTDRRVGDRVTIEPQITCGKCRMCKSGRYNMCEHVRFPSVPPYDGFLQNYISFPADLTFLLPSSCSMRLGTLVEPLCVGAEAAEVGDVCVGKTVVILGAGCIGLTTLLLCRARGAARVILSDLFQSRLDKAMEMGADGVVLGGRPESVEEIRALLGGAGADVVFETAGSPKTASMTVDVLARGGKIVMVGNVPGKTPIEFMKLMYLGGGIDTIYRYRNHYEMVIDLLARNVIPAEKIISHVFPFTRSQEAFETAIGQKDKVSKVLIEVASEGVEI